MDFVQTFLMQEFDGTAKANQAIVGSIVDERRAKTAQTKADTIISIQEKISELTKDPNKKPEAATLAGLQKIITELSRG